VKSPWIARKLIDKFKAQPNMPLKAWGVDVHNWQLHKARRIACFTVKLQYTRLWDYCETVRQINQGSCLMMILASMKSPWIARKLIDKFSGKHSLTCR
jgi:hypothetical protein